jgi:hemerythrin-like metal-binding protein
MAGQFTGAQRRGGLAPEATRFCAGSKPWRALAAKLGTSVQEESEMNTLEWSDALVLGFEPMDRMHREFVALLGQAQNATDAQLPSAWSAIVDHTARLFERENQWMRKTRFAGATDHMLQHRVVLNLLRDGLAMTRRGDLPPVREMAQELATWFVKHTQSLDAALALHLQGQADTSLRRSSA